MIPVKGAKHIKEISVGKGLLKYDSLLTLTHFKGHTMGGFGGSNKNISIGCADAHTGKKQLHAGATGQQWGITGREFMENMVDATKGITDHFKGHVCYVNVLRRMSVDCDCAGTSAEAPRVPISGSLLRLIFWRWNRPRLMLFTIWEKQVRRCANASNRVMDCVSFRLCEKSDWAARTTKS